MKFPFLISHQGGAPRRAQAPAGAQRAEGAPGLVTLKTSDTPAGAEIQIDADAARMKRLQRSVKSAAQFFGLSLGPRRFRAAMLTLTYKPGEDFSPRHISALFTRMRQWIARRGHKLHYVWVAELQKRGALHYHILVWLPRGLTLPKARQARLVAPWLYTNRMGAQRHRLSLQVHLQVRQRRHVPTWRPAARKRRTRRPR